MVTGFSNAAFRPGFFSGVCRSQVRGNAEGRNVERGFYMNHDEIILSPKYGVNPTMPVCFWCGEDRGEIALLGHVKTPENDDVEAPRRMVLDYEPCEKCKENMALGFTVMEATQESNDATSMPFQPGVFPTGRWCVLKREAKKLVFPEIKDGVEKCFVAPELFAQLQGK